MTVRSRRLCAVALLACLAAAPGCATVQRLATNSDDIAVKQNQRTVELAADFEARRDFAQFQAAQSRWREGNVVGSRENLQQILVRNPKFYEARVLLAEVLLSEEQFDKARPHLEQILTERPNNARAHHMLGLVCESTGEADEAVVHYQQATKLEPKNEQFTASYQSAAGFSPQSAGGEASATDAAVRASYDTPSRPSELESGELGKAEQAFGQHNHEEARRLLQAAVARNADSPDVAIRAGVMALRHGQNETAVTILRPAANRFSESAALARALGTAHYRQGDYQAAQLVLEHALSLDNTHALAYLLMGCTLEKLGQSSAAKSHFDQARRLDPRL